ncbi:Uncharacterised protein [Mycobacteroides abscessus subsp. abscessus]|nr:Uncharacterised protein [Mycobacteroides abscessus subsp. abscessus]SKU94123.1 Uncharacterised protein [Mycobacteroides abscessus subsp. abscessus]SKV14601.1 Uncharacterised protein [Mycobacteroides abscessus subsp. abscessus]
MLLLPAVPVSALAAVPPVTYACTPAGPGVSAMILRTASTDSFASVVP